MTKKYTYVRHISDDEMKAVGMLNETINEYYIHRYKFNDDIK